MALQEFIMLRFVLLCSFLLSQITAVEIGPVPLVGIVDGDTINVTIDGQEQRIRLLYIDAPEKNNNSHGAAMQEGQGATAALTKILDGKPVYLWGPADTLKADRYGRLLAVVHPSDDKGKVEKSAQETVIREGWTVYWRKYADAPSPYHERLMKSQQEAEQAKAGAWATAVQWMRNKSNERTAPKP